MTKYSAWIHYFRHNNWSPAQFEFRNTPTLSPEERELVCASLRQFQLGEGSDGLGLLRRCRQFSKQRSAADLPDAMQMFIREEQRHSSVLGHFLDQECIPRLQHHWVDQLFRQIRNLAGFELMLTVLVTAEFIAIPYYTAIQNATESIPLKLIAKRILRDEAQHLEFQALNLAQCAENRGDFARFLTIAIQIAALTCASALVYAMHSNLFRRASLSPLRFWALAYDAHRPILLALTSAKPGTRPAIEAYLR